MSDIDAKAVSRYLFGGCDWEDTWAPDIKDWGSPEEAYSLSYVSTQDYDAMTIDRDSYKLRMEAWQAMAHEDEAKLAAQSAHAASKTYQELLLEIQRLTILANNLQVTRIQDGLKFARLAAKGEQL